MNNLNFLIILLDKECIACYKLKSFNTKEVGDLIYYAFFNEYSVKTKKGGWNEEISNSSHCCTSCNACI